MVLKARELAAVGLRRRRSDWQAKEAKLRGVIAEAMAGKCGGSGGVPVE